MIFILYTFTYKKMIEEKDQYKINIQVIQKFCEDRNWTCLENKYIDSDYSMKWKCNICKHIWKSSYMNARSKKYCSNCNKKRIIKYTPDEIKKICKEKEIECLNVSLYKNKDTKLKWKCLSCNNLWETSFSSVRRHLGCPKCVFNKRKKLNLNIVNETIKDKTFICLSDNYKNTKEKMLWKCNVCSNSWEATFTHIKSSNSGCPNCSSFKSEKICRDYFQYFMEYNFIKKRLKCLNGLELDGYCEELKLAFEYDGEQHKKYNPHFHKNNPEIFFKQQEF